VMSSNMRTPNALIAEPFLSSSNTGYKDGRQRTQVGRVGSLHCSPVGFCTDSVKSHSLYAYNLLLSHEISSHVCTITHQMSS
jgi:hypothetical protein